MNATSNTLGFVGTGNMGRRMALRLLAAGFRLTVYDAFPAATQPLVERGATQCASPQEVARHARIVLASLPGPKEVRDVLLGHDGILTAAKPGDLFIDFSTNSPPRVKELVAEANKHGVDFLEAPVAGGTQGAENGTLTIMVGGDASTLERARPVLQPLARSIVHMGGHGAGNATKLINNLMGMAHIYAAAEAMTLGVKAGLDPRKLYEALAGGPVADVVLTQVFRTRALKGDFAPAFHLDLATKDETLAVEMGQELGAPMRMSRLVLDEYKAAQRDGLGGEDFTAVLKVLEKQMGVKVRLEGQ
ncbi:MAG: NAD(P)-dependent oxidoreductase [Chloroflexi bacterium]|nr:NAD(P)-dependent oxidoreductase [Chloroflexota bacterium]